MRRRFSAGSMVRSMVRRGEAGVMGEARGCRHTKWGSTFATKTEFWIKSSEDVDLEKYTTDDRLSRVLYPGPAGRTCDGIAGLAERFLGSEGWDSNNDEGITFAKDVSTIHSENFKSNLVSHVVVKSISPRRAPRACFEGPRKPGHPLKPRRQDPLFRGSPSPRQPGSEERCDAAPSVERTR